MLLADVRLPEANKLMALRGVDFFAQSDQAQMIFSFSAETDRAALALHESNSFASHVWNPALPTGPTDWRENQLNKINWKNQISKLNAPRRSMCSERQGGTVMHCVFSPQLKWALLDGHCCLLKRRSGPFISGDQTSQGAESILSNHLSFFLRSWTAPGQKNSISHTRPFSSLTSARNKEQQKHWMWF